MGVVLSFRLKPSGNAVIMVRWLAVSIVSAVFRRKRLVSTRLIIVNQAISARGIFVVALAGWPIFCERGEWPRRLAEEKE